MKVSRSKVDNLLARRAGLGLRGSYAWLAGQLNVSGPSLAQMFHRVENRPGTVGRLAAALNVSIEEVLADDEEK